MRYTLASLLPLSRASFAASEHADGYGLGISLSSGYA
jgi:hypothetical protein